MKKSSIRATAVGLSTITLASAFAFDVNAQALDDSEGLDFVPEEVVDTDTNSETAEIENIEKEAESLQDYIGDSYEDVKELNEAGVALDNAADSLNQTVDEIKTLAEDSKSESLVALDSSDEAIDAANGATIDEANAIIVDTQTTVDEAKANYDNSKAELEAKEAEYEQAKADYDAAMQAFSDKKNQTSDDLAQAQEYLASVEEKLTTLEAELEQIKQDLIDSSAGVLANADANKESDMSEYVATVVQHYYIPNNMLNDGETVSDFTVVSDDGNKISVSYNVIDSEGNILRTVTGDYGYLIEDDQIRIYDTDVYFQYTNASGQTKTFTKAEAEALNYLINDDESWSATGFYIPRYTADYTYSDYEIFFRYSDSLAIAEGQASANKAFDDIFSYYNTDVEFNSLRRYNTILGYYYITNFDVNYDKVDYYNVVSDTYYQNHDYNQMVAELAQNRNQYVISTEEEYSRGIVRYIQGYSLDESITDGKYESEEDVINAIRNAARLNNATDIDILDGSTFATVKNYNTYQLKLVTDNQLFDSNADYYKAYINETNNRLQIYSDLLAQIAEAKASYSQAKSEVALLQQKVDELKKDDPIANAVYLTELELQLEAAKSDFNQAKENLSLAQTKLDNAKAIYNARVQAMNAFNNSSDTQADSTHATNIISLEEVIEDEELLEEDEEELEVNLVAANQNTNSDGRNGGDADAYAYDESSDDALEDEAEVTEIPDEEVPTGITLAGLIEHGKWFAALGGVSVAGVGVGILEAKRRAAMKIIDKLNQ